MAAGCSSACPSACIASSSALYDWSIGRIAVLYSARGSAFFCAAALRRNLTLDERQCKVSDRCRPCGWLMDSISLCHLFMTLEILIHNTPMTCLATGLLARQIMISVTAMIERVHWDGVIRHRGPHQNCICISRHRRAVFLFAIKTKTLTEKASRPLKLFAPSLLKHAPLLEQIKAATYGA